MNGPKYLSFILLFLLLSNCATYKPQYKNVRKSSPVVSPKNIIHSFYLVGDAGNSPLETKTPTLQKLKSVLKNTSKNNTVLFLGDNIYPAGLPKKGAKNRAFAIHQLNAQTSIVKNFKGKNIFIPGNHDWYSNGLKGLKRQQKYVEKKLGKNTFLPKNGCPIEKVNISKEIVLITVDSEWFLTNWDKHPTINDDCEIKTRVAFFNEFESLIKKARGKTTIVALHHPLFSNGPHGGQFSLKQQIYPLENKFPLPFLGSFINLVRKTSGASNTDLQNNRYIEFKNRIITLSQENEKVIFVSGHEHSLQYLKQDNLPQIISGAGSKTTPTRNVGGGEFSYGSPGFAKLNILSDGSSEVVFFSTKSNSIVFQAQVLPPDIKIKKTTYPSIKEPFTIASIYSGKEIQKGKLYTKIWGERYRKYYGTKINVKNVDLDTLFGGLKPVRKGGGHQSKSLRLEDKEGREFVMRALRKNAVQYIQAVAFKNQHIAGQFENTYSENLLLDIFTGSHPYAPFVIATLAKAVGVFHTKPELYYVPKQKALAEYNTDFGNELYMIEERAASGHGDKSNFGFSNKVISTNDVLKKLRKNANFKIDENAYIRARLFDMLIGDWDRHEDQWRWAIFKKGTKTIYKPIPRDRDQAFSIMADGALLNFVTKSVPALRLMQSYGEEMESPKWFNLEPYPLDMALINESKKATWNRQVKHIQKKLTPSTIDEAFVHFPEEILGKTTNEIKRKLKGRLKNLQKIAHEYYLHLTKFSVIKGTDKSDWFDVERLPNGQTKITGYRIKKNKKEAVFHQKIYTKENTKEIWIYGLDDKDTFVVFGKGKNPIKIRLIGGQNNDTFTIKNGKKVTFYDYKSKKNNITTTKGIQKLTNNYKTNVYDYKKLKYDAFAILPTIGFNPDDGIKTGLTNTYTTFGFERNPFTAQHILEASYYFATKGYELNYSGEFSNIYKNWNLLAEIQFTSPNYAINFFGFGNNSQNLNAIDDDMYEEDYNRVKIRFLKTAASLIWRGKLGGSFKIGASYESNKVDKTLGRFINVTNQISNTVFETQKFLGAEATYHFSHNDNNAFPTLGMETNLQVGYKKNTNNANRFGYLITSLRFDYKLTENGQVVLATKLKNHLNFGTGYEFYQAASIGGKNGLRGFRNQRFTGKKAFYQNTDIRFNLRKIRTSLVPINIGFFSGFDYGKVWDSYNVSDNWNTSFGGGIFFNAADMINANISVFKGSEPARVSFSLGFQF